ncbi:helix-turn-helix domain-containing protein [Nocardia ignorata]|uniref:helix-turn-helix domain-containing protein n=1 Tax=Nocardia ignorata TaxID=145285 RepID=UPI0036409629
MSANVRRLRKAQNLSLRDFADRLTELDWPLGHTAIDKIEKGSRRVDVDDLVALAQALKTSPADLLTPASDAVDSPVIATATTEMPAQDLARWIRSYPVDLALFASGDYWDQLRIRIRNIQVRHPDVIATMFELDDLSQLRELVSRGDD